MTQAFAQTVPSEEAAANAGVTRWWLVVLLMAVCFLSHMNRVSMPIAGDTRIMTLYGIEPVKMGWIYSAFLIVYTLFMIPGGIFIDRVGVRVALGFMALATGLCGALTGLGGFVAAAQIWLWLVVVRSIMGFCTIPLHPGSARAIGLWLPSHRQVFANGLVTGAALLGIACTPPLFGALIDRIGWQRAFMVTGGCTAMLGALWLLATRRLPFHTAQSATRETATLTWKEFFTSRSLVLLTLSYAAIGYFQYLFFYWMHYYFKEILLLGDSQSRTFAALPTFAMALTMPIGGWLSQSLHARYGWRAGRVLVAGVAMLAAVVFLTAGVITKVHLATVIFFTAALGSLGFSEAVFWQTAVELGGSRGASAAAVMNTGGNGIGFLAPVLTPWIAARLGWQAGIAVGAAVCLLGALCWLWIRPSPDTNGQDTL